MFKIQRSRSGKNNFIEDLEVYINENKNNIPINKFLQYLCFSLEADIRRTIRSVSLTKLLMIIRSTIIKSLMIFIEICSSAYF